MILAWEDEHGQGPDPGLFTQDILPGLQAVTLTRMAAASGLSIQYCSGIRSGKHVPHAMHWDALREAAAL